MLLSLTSLYACSNKQEQPQVVYTAEKLYIPAELLTLNCSETLPYLSQGGELITARSLSYAYIKDRGCLRAYIKLVEGLKNKYTQPSREETQDVGK